MLRSVIIYNFLPPRPPFIATKNAPPRSQPTEFEASLVIYKALNHSGISLSLHIYLNCVIRLYISIMYRNLNGPGLCVPVGSSTR